MYNSRQKIKSIIIDNTARNNKQEQINKPKVKAVLDEMIHLKFISKNSGIKTDDDD